MDSGIRYSHGVRGRATLGYDFVLEDDPENTDPAQGPGEDCRGHGTPWPGQWVAAHMVWRRCESHICSRVRVHRWIFLFTGYGSDRLAYRKCRSPGCSQYELGGTANRVNRDLYIMPSRTQSYQGSTM
jgi:hypothetical protein